MNFQNYLLNIQLHLIDTHAQVLRRFDADEALLHFEPANSGWTVLEILEHISLTSHYLLKLIHKGADKALRNVNQLNLGQEIKTSKFDLNRLSQIGVHQSFPWQRPEHMVPSGNVTPDEIKATLVNQLRECLDQLDQLKNGEGLLYQTTMSVDNIGKLNVYEYIYFLSQHAARHLQQMKWNEQAFGMSI